MPKAPERIRSRSVSVTASAERVGLSSCGVASMAGSGGAGRKAPRLDPL